MFQGGSEQCETIRIAAMAAIKTISVYSRSRKNHLCINPIFKGIFHIDDIMNHYHALDLDISQRGAVEAAGWPTRPNNQLKSRELCLNSTSPP